MASYRREKLEELIKRVVADALLAEIKDPRIGFVTVVKTRLSRDYSTADVWVSVLGSEKDKEKSIAGLESACSYLQYLVGKGVKLRVTPRLRFHLDTSIEEGVNLVNLIERAEKGIDREEPVAESEEAPGSDDKK
jgi:ribosome-binding factor A